MTTREKRIYLSPPHMSGGEMKYIQEAFDQNWIAPLGPNVDAFEKAIADYTGIGHVAALSSGTAAIHLGLIILGVEPGDEVIASTFTFSATVNPIVYLGAVPILVDSEPETWNMDPELLEKAIKSRMAKGKKPKAILPVHLYGMPAKMDEIMKIANRYEIPVLEDAAEALGSKLGKQYAGTFGKIGVLSFNGNKILNTSGGGALLSNDREIVEKARFLSTQARDQARHYQHSHIGYNYRMSNILAGVGRGQMEVIQERVEKRRENFDFYFKNLQQLDGITLLREPSDRYFSNRWLTTLLINPKKTGITAHELQLALEEVNIETRPLWKPMHLQPVFSKYPSFVNGLSEKLFSEGVCLPSGTSLTDDDRKYILQHLLSNLVK
jgi:dTDP-4-amino-4,6-dideoxygalactose transaminase